MRRLCGRTPWLVSWLFALSLVPGCGGGSSGPTSPPPAPPTASSLDFTIVPAVGGATVASFRWSGSGASSFRIEIGRSSGGSDVGAFETPASTYTWTGVPLGNFYVRVRGQQGGTVGLPSNEVLVGSIDPRHVIDALFFSFGPLAVAGNSGRGLNTGFWQDRVLGWQPGSGFAVVLGDSVPAAFAAAAEKTVRQIAGATREAVQAGILGRRPDPLATPALGEVTMSFRTVDELRAECSCDACVGCARTFYLGAFAQRAQIYFSSQASTPTAAHELGHVIGLAHIISAVGVRPPLTMGLTTDGQFAAGGRLDELDPATVKALETVYGFGLTAGSTRRQFEAAGFVLPEGAMASSLAISDRSARRQSVRQEGLETVVLKPFCETVER